MHKIHKKRPLVQNAVSVTLLSLLLRVAGLFCISRISAAIGAEGVGLFQLTMAVQSLAVTVATSGVRFTVTRLLSEELGLNRQRGAGSAMRICFLYALLFSLAACGVMYHYADPLARFAGDERIASSLRFLAAGLPPLALNAVFGGYFSAMRQPWKASLSQILEQGAMTLLVLLLLKRTLGAGLEASCAMIALCSTAADAMALLFSLLLFLQGRPAQKGADAGPMGRRMLHLSLPLALSAYARSALNTLQHLLIPKALRKNGASAAAALAVYGTVSGMAMPVLGFAAVFFGVVAELLIPELTRAQVRTDRRALERMTGRVLRLCLLGSIGISLLLLLTAPLLGQLLYRSPEPGRYIRLLAPLCILMYMDSVTDGMLKGLGMHMDSMLINIADAILTLLLTWLLLPPFGADAYIMILYISEGLNFAASFFRLRRKLNIKLLSFPENWGMISLLKLPMPASAGRKVGSHGKAHGPGREQYPEPGFLRNPPPDRL